MKEKILNIATVGEYDNMLGLKTLNPLVSVIDLSTAKPMRHMRHTFSFCAVYLKDEVNCEIIYGRQRYDYQKGSVVCLAPGQVIGIEDNGEVFQPKGWALCFSPELIRSTSLGKNIGDYSFFSYNVNEALHLSADEREIFLDCLRKISMELHRATDRLSRRLIVSNIELLLNYCLRFYERQFVTREMTNSDLLSRFERLIDDFIRSERMMTEGLPTVKWCAERLCLSPNYFGDLIKKETGITPQEYIHRKIIDVAKEQLYSTGRNISEIAYGLGFQYPQHFSRLFRKTVGVTPTDFRNGKNAGTM